MVVKGVEPQRGREVPDWKMLPTPPTRRLPPTTPNPPHPAPLAPLKFPSAMGPGCHEGIRQDSTVPFHRSAHHSSAPATL